MCLFCCAFFDFFLIYIYRPIYRHIGFLNHKIFVSVSALKILYRSGSSVCVWVWVCVCVFVLCVSSCLRVCMWCVSLCMCVCMGCVSLCMWVSVCVTCCICSLCCFSPTHFPVQGAVFCLGPALGKPVSNTTTFVGFGRSCSPGSCVFCGQPCNGLMFHIIPPRTRSP